MLFTIPSHGLTMAFLIFGIDLYGSLKKYNINIKIETEIKKHTPFESNTDINDKITKINPFLCNL